MEQPLRKLPGDVLRWPIAPADELLVAALREGRPQAGDALFRAYASYVRKIVLRILGPDQEVDDLVQDVFAGALGSLHQLTEPKALRGWLAQIAVFQTRRRLRARKQWRILRFLAPSDVPEQRAAPPDFEASEALRATYRVLAQLDPDERVAFALRFVEGMELTEAAAACNVSLATLKRRLMRAQTRFRALASDEPALAERVGERP